MALTLENKAFTGIDSGQSITVSGFDGTGATLLIAVVFKSLSNPEDTFTDSSGNTWASPGTLWGGGDYNMITYACFSPTVTSNMSFTFTEAFATSDKEMAIFAFSGTSGSNFTQAPLTGSSSSGTTFSQAFTPSSASSRTSIVIGCVANTGASLSSVGSGQTQLVDETNVGSRSSFHLSAENFSSTAANAQSHTWSNSDGNARVIYEVNASGTPVDNTGGDPTISAESGTFTITGTDATLTYNASAPAVRKARWSGGAVSILPTTSWAAPNGMFPTEDINIDSAFSFNSGTSTVTLPSTDLPDGYLFIGHFDFTDTSNGRHNPSGRFIQTGGSGNFVSNASSGYNRDNSEDLSMVRCWAFLDNPSAGATVQFQWRRDSDTPSGGTEQASFEVIPFYYDDIGLYSSSAGTVHGGTTPTLITGWAGTDGTNITLGSNQVTVTADNKRFLVLAGYWFAASATNRTQRWGMVHEDGSRRDDMKGYSYLRNGSNNQGGEMMSGIIETATASKTIDLRLYRGDGIANDQGGASSDVSTASTLAQHALVVIELPASAEVIAAENNSQENMDLTAGLDIDVWTTVNIQDTDSFTKTSNEIIEVQKDGDYLFGGNISGASDNVGSGARHTGFSYFKVNGTDVARTRGGDYCRNNQSSNDTFGISNNIMSSLELSVGDDIEVSAYKITGGEGGSCRTQPGWSGAWGINLDTLSAPPVNDYTISAESGTFTITGTDANLEYHRVISAESTSYTITGTDVTLTYGRTISVDPATYVIAGTEANLEYHRQISAEVGTYNIVGFQANLEYNIILTAEPTSYIITGQDAGLVYGQNINAELGSYSITGIDAALLYSKEVSAETGVYNITGTSANLEYHRVLLAELGTYTIIGQDANLEYGSVTTIIAEPGTFTITGQDATLTYTQNYDILAELGTFVITGTDASLELGIRVEAEIGTFVIIGQDVSFLLDYSLITQAGAYTITGEAANLEYHRVIVAEPTSYLIIGTDADLSYNKAIDASVGNIVILGQDATLIYGSQTIIGAETGSFVINGTVTNLEYHRVLNLDTGVYSITGQDITLAYQYRLESEPGSFVITGQDATLTKTIVYNIAAESGAYSITGFDTQFLVDYNVIAQSGNISIQGQEANLEYNQILSLDPGTFTIAGQDVTLVYGSVTVINAETGTLIITGQDANFIITLSANPGVINITGNTAELIYDRLLVAESSSYTITGNVADLLYGRAIDLDSGLYTIDGQNVDFIRTYIIPIDLGVYVINGQDASLEYSNVLKIPIEVDIELIDPDILINVEGCEATLNLYSNNSNIQLPDSNISINLDDDTLDINI